MRRGEQRPVILAAVALAVAGCARPGSGLPAAPSPAPTGPTAPAFVTPSRLLPDLVGERGVVGEDDGQRRVLVDRMRVLARDDGSLERATQLLPLGHVQSVRLPSRLGGGFLFHASTNGGTQLWRAAGWLAPLQPLVQIASVATEVVPGIPGRFSTSTVWPQAVVSLSATMRARISVELPAENGTTMRTVWLG